MYEVIAVESLNICTKKTKIFYLWCFTVQKPFFGQKYVMFQSSYLKFKEHLSILKTNLK